MTTGENNVLVARHRLHQHDRLLAREAHARVAVIRVIVHATNTCGKAARPELAGRQSIDVGVRKGLVEMQGAEKKTGRQSGGDLQRGRAVERFDAAATLSRGMEERQPQAPRRTQAVASLA